MEEGVRWEAQNFQQLKKVQSLEEGCNDALCAFDSAVTGIDTYHFTVTFFYFETISWSNGNLDTQNVRYFCSNVSFRRVIVHANGVHLYAIRISRLLSVSSIHKKPWAFYWLIETSYFPSSHMRNKTLKFSQKRFPLSLSLFLVKGARSECVWWVGGELLTFLPRVLDGGEWSASCPVQYIRWEKATGTHWIESKGRSERFGGEENMSLMSIIDPRFLSRPFLSLITILTELSRFTWVLSCWFISTFSTSSLISKGVRPYTRRIKEIVRDFNRFLCLDFHLWMHQGVFGGV
jgi:hypothetical protein